MKGFSGGSVEVRVRKRAANKDKNTRLDYEITRLNHIGENYSVKTPEIHQDSRILVDGVMQCEMEYIPGRRLEDQLVLMAGSELQLVAYKLVSFIIECSKHTPCPLPRGAIVIPEDQFIDKKLRSVMEFMPESEDKSAYRSYVEHLSYPEPIRSTMCHGDLALDNIIYTPSCEVYLIDALCQDFDNYHWDIAKVLQSCLCHWTEVRENREIEFTDASYLFFAATFMKALEGVADPQRIALYLATTLARIIPYCQKDRQRERLLEMTNFCLEQYIEGNEIQGAVPCSR